MKKIAKAVIRWVFLIAAALPLFLMYKLVFLSSTRCFTTISELLSLLPGYAGYFARQGFYMLALKSDRTLHTGFGTILQYPSIRTGHDAYIGQDCNIAKCTIGSGVKIGSGVHIVNKDTHCIGKDGKILPTDAGKLKRVLIGDNTWIGNNAVILADVGENSIIGAGSVVVKPIPSDSVAVGNPARVIRKR